MKMLGKKMGSVKKLAKKVKVIGASGRKPFDYECLVTEHTDESSSPSTTPTGFFAVYVGEERQRFVVPTSFLSHPLFKMMLEKAENEFGYDQTNGLVVPCSVAAFQEAVNVVECCYGQFHLENLVEQFL